VDEEVLREAKEIGLNISKIAENALKEAIRRLKAPFDRNGCGLLCFNGGLAGGVGFEPTTSGSGGLRFFLRPLPGWATRPSLSFQFKFLSG